MSRTDMAFSEKNVDLIHNIQDYIARPNMKNILVSIFDQYEIK